MSLNIQSQNLPSFGEAETYCKRLQDFSLQDTAHVFRKGKGLLVLLNIYIWEKKGSVEEGRKLSLFRLEGKYFRRSMNITNNPKQDSCA